MLNERQDGFINELKETYERLNGQSQANGNFNFIDVSVFQDDANKFNIRKEEIIAENKAVRDGYMETFIRDVEMLANDLEKIGITISYGTTTGSQKYSRYVYLKCPNGNTLYTFKFEDKEKSNASEDNSLPHSLVQVYISEKYGIHCESIKDLVEVGNFKVAIKNYLRYK